MEFQVFWKLPVKEKQDYFNSLTKEQREIINKQAQIQILETTLYHLQGCKFSKDKDLRDRNIEDYKISISQKKIELNNFLTLKNSIYHDRTRDNRLPN